MWVVGRQSSEQVGSEGVASGEVWTRILWVGGQGFRLGVNAGWVSIRAVLGVNLSYGDWMRMSGTRMA